MPLVDACHNLRPVLRPLVVTWDICALTKPDHNAVPIDLTAVIVAVTGEEPRVLTIREPDQNPEALPTGPFERMGEGRRRRCDATRTQEPNRDRLRSVRPLLERGADAATLRTSL